MEATKELAKANGGGGSAPMARRVVNYQPAAPVGSTGGLKGLMDGMRDSIAQMLPKHITPERLFKTMLVAVNRNPALLQCTQASIFETINRAAELGLDLSGTLGEAYPVPFNNKIKQPDGSERWGHQCTLIIGYRGLEKLAWQSGEVKEIGAEVVYEHDRFLFRQGFNSALEHEPKLDGDRGKPIGAYAYIITKQDGRMARFMPKGDIEKIRQGSKSGNSPAWKNHWDEMARKTALRRVLKDAPLSTEKLIKAMEQDDRDYRLTEVFEAETQRPQGSRSKALLTELRGTEAPAGELPEGEGSLAEEPQATDYEATDAPEYAEERPADPPADSMVDDVIGTLGKPAAESPEEDPDGGMFDPKKSRGRR